MSITLQSTFPALYRLHVGRDLPVLPLAILVPFVFIAVFANFIAPYDPTEPIPGAKIFEPPFWSTGGSTRALLGTDFQGRDVVSRLIFGARVSLLVGVMGTIVAGSIGTTLGMLAGYIGGWVDQLIMRVTDAWLALPAIVFAIFLATTRHAPLLAQTQTLARVAAGLLRVLAARVGLRRAPLLRDGARLVFTDRLDHLAERRVDRSNDQGEAEQKHSQHEVIHRQGVL
jgi:ABC-type dipeptide/oligopeptide/nickel transport system permease subunit